MDFDDFILRGFQCILYRPSIQNRHAILAAISIMAGLCGVFVVGYCFVELKLMKNYPAYYFS
jgi:hypothetical protein